MRTRSLIIGGALLFGPLGCGSTPTVGAACTEGQKDCVSGTASSPETGYFCKNGTWTSTAVQFGGCDCFVAPSSQSCPAIGYVGIEHTGQAEARAARPKARRIRDRLVA